LAARIAADAHPAKEPRGDSRLYYFLIEMNRSDKFFLAQQKLYWTLPAEQNTKEETDHGSRDLQPQEKIISICQPSARVRVLFDMTWRSP
jgi:hypothetical protein